MTWTRWCCLSIVLNFIIFTETKPNLPPLIIQNIIPKRINPDLLRIDIKKGDETVLYQLKLRKAKGILANSQTSVYQYLDDIPERRQKFYADYEVMQEIGNFSFYHDIDNKASAVLFSDNNGHYLDGIISDAFRLNRFPVNYLDDILKRPGRSVNQESGSNVEALDDKTLSTLNSAVQNIGAFYPELLIVLDYNLLVESSKVQAIKTQLVYWNAVDMLFTSMKSPEIHLNIAAFILPSSPHTFPFLENDPGTDFVDFYDAIEGFETLFYEYQNQVPVDYDILVTMTRSKLCVRPSTANPVMNCINGFSEAKPDMVNKFDDERKTLDSAALLHFDNQISSYTNAAQKIAYMFTGEFTQKRELRKCPGIMEEYYRRGKFSLSWSACTQRKVTDYLQSPKAQGLKNFPKYLSKEQNVQLLTTEPPKPTGGWLGSLNNWWYNKNNDKTTDVIITTEATVPETTEHVAEMNDADVDLQQVSTTSETSPMGQTDLFITTEATVPETTEHVAEINDANIDLQQSFTTSEAYLDHLSTTPSPTVYSTLTPTSKESSENLENDINTTSPSPSGYSSPEPSSENYPVDDIILTSNVEDYSTSTSSSESFLDNNKLNEPLISKFKAEEEEITTLESVFNYSELKSEDLSSTTAKSLIEQHDRSQDQYIFVDVTVPNEESDGHTDVTENSLVESTVSLELTQQNISNLSVVDLNVQKDANRQKRQERFNLNFLGIFNNDKVNENDEEEHKLPIREIVEDEQSDQGVLPNEQEHTKTPDLPSTFQTSNVLDSKMLARENILEIYRRAKRLNDSKISVTTSAPSLESILNRASELNDTLIELDNSNTVASISTTVSITSSTEPSTSSTEPSTLTPTAASSSTEPSTLTPTEASSSTEPSTLTPTEASTSSSTEPSTSTPTEALTLSSIEPSTSTPTEASTLTPTEASTSSSTEPSTSTPTEALTLSSIEPSTSTPTEASTLTPTEASTSSSTEPSTSTPTEALTSSSIEPSTSTPTEASTSTPTEAASSTELTASTPTELSCKREKMNLDVTLNLNINTNDKNIKTLKKTLHGDLLNQDNQNITNTTDKDKVIANIIEYLLANSDR